MAVEPLVVSPGPMVPQPYVVRSRDRETADTWTIELEPVAGETIDPEPGQFAMLTAYGVGEVPISLSGRGADGSLIHTIRDVGAVTAELCRVPRGGAIGVRGPFGTTWPLEEARGADVVVLAGGLGLAPLRPAVEGLLARRDSYGRLLLLYGARTPGDLLYPQQLEDWRADGLDVRLTVDAGTRSWLDRVGFVSALLDDVTARLRVRGCARLRPRGDDAGHRGRASPTRCLGGAHVCLARAQHELRNRPLRPLPARAHPDLP